MQGHDFTISSANPREQSFVPGSFGIDTENCGATNVFGRRDGYIIFVLLMARCLQQPEVTLAYANAFIVWEFSATDLHLERHYVIGKGEIAESLHLLLEFFGWFSELATIQKYRCLKFESERDRAIVNSGWLTICLDAMIDSYWSASLLPLSMC